MMEKELQEKNQQSKRMAQQLVSEVMGIRNIYFDEARHQYTDEFGSVYTSVTTVIKRYEPEFKKKEIAEACARIGRNPNHPKYYKYAGKTANELLAEWKKISEDACDVGNQKHGYLENIVKTVTGYKTVGDVHYINDRIYTVPEILSNPLMGEVSLAQFEKIGIKEKYPQIYNIIKVLASKGYRAYSEIGVYWHEYLISGLIDLLMVNYPYFIIVDWKTNKYPIEFDGGYYNKKEDGSIEYIRTPDTFLSPLTHLPNSNGYKYALQLSTYSYLCEMYGLKYQSSILCRIDKVLYDEHYEAVQKNPALLGKEKVDLHEMPYLKKEVELMIGNFISNSQIPMTTYEKSN